ncbi:MAG: hypothetical protein PHH44_07705 [bacterium]|nr:hypothetical protein [bacterium]
MSLRKTGSKAIMLATVFMFLSVSLYANDNDNNKENKFRLAPAGLWWITAGIGVDGFFNKKGGYHTEGFSHMAESSYNTSYGLFSGRYLYSREGLNGTNRIKEVGILYGLMLQKRNFGVGFSAGVNDLKGFYKYNKTQTIVEWMGVVPFYYVDEHSAMDFHTTGFTGEFQLLNAQVMKNLGSGIKLFYNWNPVMPFYGMSVNVYIGRLK